LGDFLELEVVLEEGEDSKTGEAIARDLMQKLGVLPEQLIEGAYIDLLRAKDQQPNPLNA
jgi:adenylate cyclase class IV